MSLRERARPGLGIIEPRLPSPAKVPPSAPGWLHETSCRRSKPLREARGGLFLPGFHPRSREVSMQNFHSLARSC
jgi:hypothetical protein